MLKSLIATFTGCPYDAWIDAWNGMPGDTIGNHDAGAIAKLDVSIQALHLVHHPVCWARLSGMLSNKPQESHSKSVTEAVNALGHVEAQTLAQAERAIKSAVLPAVNLQVNLIFNSAVRRTAMCNVICTLDSVLSSSCSLAVLHVHSHTCAQLQRIERAFSCMKIMFCMS